MGYETDSQLNTAEEHFYAWRLMDAYNILRRYYSRLPFRPEDGHGQHIGMFIRVLSELGKTRELNFYLPELERLHHDRNSVSISYQLGMVYASTSPLRLEAAKKVFEEVIADPEAGEYRVKACIMLAWIHDKRDGDPAICRKLLDAIPPQEDRDLALNIAIWRAKMLRDEKKYAKAETELLKILETLELPRDWYPYTSAKIILTRALFLMDRYEDALEHLVSLKQACEGRHFRSIELQMMDLEKLLKRNPELEKLVLERGSEYSTLRFREQSWQIKGVTTPERILLLLLRQRFVDRASILKEVFRRKYRGEADDKLIYSYMHTLRKQFSQMGLPENTILRDEGGYRLLPDVDTIGGVS